MEPQDVSLCRKATGTTSGAMGPVHGPFDANANNTQLGALWRARRTQASLYVLSAEQHWTTPVLRISANLCSASGDQGLGQSLSASADDETPQPPRRPRSLQAIYLKPLKREAEFGIPSCDLQLRSFSIQPLEFFADFALRAAYYLRLPAYGPVPLPRITERWTVPKSHFVFKKAQENFERITLRRMIQIKDGHPETVQIWLAYLRKHQYYGVGMKANVWEFSQTGVGRSMGLPQDQLKELESSWSHLGQTRNIGTTREVECLLSSRRFQEAVGSTRPRGAIGGK